MDDLRNVTTSWIAPPFSALVVENCTAATDWMAARIESMRGDGVFRDGTLLAGLSFLKSMVPANWTQPTAADLAAWYIDVWSAVDYGVDEGLDDVRNRSSAYAYSECGSMICEKLDWQGDDNVSGIGMMISYYLAAALATLYFIVLVPSRLGYYRSLPGKFPRLSRFVEAFRESVNTFLDTALIFAVAMLGAAVVRYARVIRQREEEFSAYALYGSTAMSAFAIFPAIMLQAVADGLRGRFLRQFLWLLVICLTIVVEGMYAHQLSEEEEAEGYLGLFSKVEQTDQWIWANLCEAGDFRDDVRTSLTIAHVILGINVIWWLYYVVSSLTGSQIKSRVYKMKIWELWSRLRPWLRVASGILSFSIMWALLVVFSHYRTQVMTLSKHSNEDDRWTFGQVLALATWCPVLVDYAAVLIYGPERGLSERLSRRYKVVATKEPDEKNTSYSESLRYDRIDQIGHHNARSAAV